MREVTIVDLRRSTMDYVSDSTHCRCKVKTPSARLLHYWLLNDGGIELSSVLVARRHEPLNRWTCGVHQARA